MVPNDDSGIIIFKFLQNLPISKAVCNKIIICIFFNILIFLRENKVVSFFSSLNIFKLKQSFLTWNINDYGQILKFQFSTVKSALLSLTTVHYCSRIE